MLGVVALLLSILLSLANTAHTSHLLSNVSRVDGSAACQNLPPSFPPPETASTAIFCVDMNGCCNFTTVQAAVDAVPNNSQRRSILWINVGIFVEKVVVKKPNITFQGQGLNVTMIVWIVERHGDNCRQHARQRICPHRRDWLRGKKNISFKNAAPAPKPGVEGAQAMALRVSGDQAAFWGCGIFGAQDTLFDDQHRHYFKECIIQGTIDFVFGDGRSLYENCTLDSVAEDLPKEQRYINGAITAQGRRFPDNNTGFPFVGCTIKGSGWILLGRAWQAYSRVVFAYTYMPDIVAAAGWDNWGHDDRNSTVFYGQFECIGDGADVAHRVPYARNLDKSEAEPFLSISYIEGAEWLKPFNDNIIAY